MTSTVQLCELSQPRRIVDTDQTNEPAECQHSMADESQQLEALYKTASKELWAKLYGMCGDPERARDAVQESFLRLQQYGIHHVKTPQAWLLHVGRNWLCDVSRRRADGEVTATSAGNSATSRDRNPLKELQHKESQALMRRALRELKLLDREVLVLRYGLGWSADRIAISLNSRSTAIDMRISRARTRLVAVLATISSDSSIDARTELTESSPVMATT
jgi:RNA polymerase sigma factor (sigma-70 family)